MNDEITLRIKSILFAAELLQWVKDEQAHWPDETLYQEELSDLRKQLEEAVG